MEIPPQASLYIASGCSHCPSVLDALSRLTKEGAISRLEVVNLSLEPDAAPSGIRSVPWCRIGPFELTGAQNYTELAHWAASSSSKSAMGDYISQQLEAGELDNTLGIIRRSPEILEAVIPLIATLETPMAVRIGIGAVLETLGEEGMLSAVLNQLSELSQSEIAQVRADASHYLGISGDKRAIPILKTLLEDQDQEVREIAAESLEELSPPV